MAELKKNRKGQGQASVDRAKPGQWTQVPFICTEFRGDISALGMLFPVLTGLFQRP